MGQALKFYRKVPRIVKELRFVDQKNLEVSPSRLRRLTEFIGRMSPTFSIDLGPGQSVGLTLPHLGKVDKSVTEKIERFVRELERHDQISLERPMGGQDGWSGKLYVLERTCARRLYFPPAHIELIPKLRNFAVWVSDPINPEEALRRQDIDCFSFSDTFLFLIECTWENIDPYQMTLSGVSALKAIVNLRMGNIPLERSRKFEKYGRDCNLHPVEKLIEAGAVLGEKMNIETLYRKRYITDEQSYLYAGRNLRVCDLIGYPVYIASIP